MPHRGGSAVGHVYQQVVQYISCHVDRMGPQECFWMLVAVIIIGGVCLRGFGSRSGY